MASKNLAPSFHDIVVSGPFGEINVHYLAAGAKTKPVLLLLMGFPSSSTHYRDFASLIADEFYVLAPDFPGFGLTKAPASFTYTFDNLAVVISAWLKQMGITAYASYMFDYGAPVGFRLALANPSSVKAIISQNGNAYDEGFGQQFWAPIFSLWDTNNSQEAREVVRKNVLTQDTTTFQYYMGVPERDSHLVDPEKPILDYVQNIAGKENQEHQLDLFYDYRNNKASYPEWHDYLEQSQVPLLAVWGKGDLAFVPAGAEAYKTHAKNAEVHLLDAGHFALETARWQIADLCKAFLRRVAF